MIMLNGPRLITKGIQESLPIPVQLLLWQFIDTMPVSEKDYLQIFTLVTSFRQGQPRLTIQHKQECPEYAHTTVVDLDHVIHEKVYVIDDAIHDTKLLAE